VSIERLRRWAEDARRGDPSAYDGPELEDVEEALRQLDTRATISCGCVARCGDLIEGSDDPRATCRGLRA
jgi:hypothetical protein